MAATLYLLGCILMPGQMMMRPEPSSALAPARTLSSASDWLLVPRLHRGQELVYRGVFTEENRGGRVQFGHSYRLESRILVLETPPQGVDVAVLTQLKHRSATSQPALDGDAAPVSVRLERARVDLQGKVTADAGVNLQVPLDRAPTLECGGFIALPAGRIHVGQEWVAPDGERPPLTWRAVGTEMVAGNSCIKVIGEQKSEDWDHPRADHAAWRRQETVWLAPHLGLAYRIEREILQREPAHREPTQRSLLRLEMDSSFLLAGQAADSRLQEVKQALAFRDSLAPYLAQPAKYGPHLAALRRRIEQYMTDQPESPYRPAIVQVKHRVEAAQRGEVPPEPIRDIRPVLTGAAVGRRAPDFIAGNLTGTGSVHLRSLLGKPIVLVFYHPSSPTSPTVLRYAQQLQARYRQRLCVVGMSISDNAELVKMQRAELELWFPVLSAGGLRTSFGVASTPKIVLLDSSNIIRGEYLGWAWGGETARELEEELKHWLPIGASLPPVPQPAH